MIFAFYATTQITTIDSAARFLINCGAGLGMVLILRWYWWRINAWSEIAATLAPVLAYYVCTTWLEEMWGQEFVQNNGTMLVTVGFTTVVWISVTLLTKPVETRVLSKFYNRVKPEGWWRGFLEVNPDISSVKHDGHIGGLILAWISAIVMTYSILFFTGYTIFQEWKLAAIWMVVGIVGFLVLARAARTTGIFDDSASKKSN